MSLFETTTAGSVLERPAEERDALCVLFADLSGSSRLFKQVGDERAQSIVAERFALMAEAVSRAHGRVVKTIGDEVMAVFRAVNDACAAASDIHFELERANAGDVDLQAHIGLHFGPVVQGDDDIFGDTVNVAAAVTKLAHAGEILLTESVAARLSGEWKRYIESVFSQVLKGQPEPTELFRLHWEEDATERTVVNRRGDNLSAWAARAMVFALTGKRVSLDYKKAGLTIGREPDCDLNINAGHVSRMHATVRYAEGHFYLQDHSLNGTFVTPYGGNEIHVFRREILLERGGVLVPGCRAHDDGAVRIEYYRSDLEALRPQAPEQRQA